MHPGESAFKAKALEYTEKYALPALFVGHVHLLQHVVEDGATRS